MNEELNASEAEMRALIEEVKKDFVVEDRKLFYRGPRPTADQHDLKWAITLTKWTLTTYSLPGEIIHNGSIGTCGLCMVHLGLFPISCDYEQNPCPVYAYTGEPYCENTPCINYENCCNHSDLPRLGAKALGFLWDLWREQEED